VAVNITDTEVVLFRNCYFLGAKSMTNMTNQTDIGYEIATTSRTTIEANDSFFLSIVSTQKASEKFVFSIKDLYQELKNAPTRRANIEQ
jgi:hypothetical protein